MSFHRIPTRSHRPVQGGYLILPVLSLILTLLIPSIAQSQQENKISTEIHGFVKSDVWADSRRIVGAREELLLLIPERIKLDSAGVDVNARPGVGFSAITSRVNIRSKGAKAFGADAEGFIEADFSGVTNADINTFRLRHAYLKLNWEKSQLLFGQYWHPSFTPECFPEVISLNTGAPFQPFIRNPLIQFSTGKRLKLLLAAVGQRDYANDGPSGRIPDYLRYAGVPNLHLQIKTPFGESGTSVAGIGIDFKRIRPQALSISSVQAQSSLDSWSFMAFFRYRAKNWTLASKAILGQNMSEHLLLGGYALSRIDTISGAMEYTPGRHVFYWVNLVIGEQGKPGYRFGMFGGYALNLGTLAPNLGVYYGRGYDIASMYRVSGFLAWRQGPVEFSAEMEFTNAAYGTPDLNAVVNNSKGVGNFRTIISAFYFF